MNILNGVSVKQDEVIEKMLRKIDLLKKEARVFKEDNEKIVMDLEYAKKIIEEKNAQIELMEKKSKKALKMKLINVKQVR